MVIIKKATLTLFGKKHPDVYDALMEWYKKVNYADWESFHDVKENVQFG